MTGGGGADHFRFTTALSATTNVDTITDFTHAQGDKIDLDNAVMAALGAAGSLGTQFYAAAGANNGHDANDHIVYNAATGALYYDSNGSAAGGVTQIAVVAGHPALVVGDFTIV
jgi:Ca2+-binding RTX toxin-like protein